MELIILFETNKDNEKLTNSYIIIWSYDLYVLHKI